MSRANATGDRGITCTEAAVLDAHPDAGDRARRLAAAMVEPLLALEGDSTAEALRFWAVLTAYLLGVAESRVGTEGRDAIVQTLRNARSAALMCSGRMQ